MTKSNCDKLWQYVTVTNGGRDEPGYESLACTGRSVQQNASNMVHTYNGLYVQLPGINLIAFKVSVCIRYVPRASTTSGGKTREANARRNIAENSSSRPPIPILLKSQSWGIADLYSTLLTWEDNYHQHKISRATYCNPRKFRASKFVHSFHYRKFLQTENISGFTQVWVI